MKLRSLWLLPLLAVTTTTAVAQMGLPQVRHTLFLDSRAPVEADLRRLAERGDRPSMLLLGNVLAGDPRRTDEAIGLYRRAFANGKGEIRALTSLSRLLDRLPRLQGEHEDFTRDALKAFPLERDPYTLEAALETFLVYPQLFSHDQIERLLALFQRSCLEQCSSDLYRAVYAERTGNRDEAERWYQSAVRVDPRAIERYYRFLGEDRDRLFVEFTQHLEAERPTLPAEILHPVGSLLESIAATENEVLTLPYQRLRTERDLLEEEVRQEQALEERYRIARQNAQAWTEAAIALDYPPAIVSRINYILSWSNEHTEGEALALSERLSAFDAQRAKASLAQIKLVNTWPTLDPHAAHQMIQELIADGYEDGELLLAALYSRGSLDQPDQARALQILERLADKGSLVAYYRLALLYSQGRGLCRDLPKTFAYATLVHEGGDRRGANLLRSLEPFISDEQREAGRIIHQQLTARSLP